MVNDKVGCVLAIPLDVEAVDGAVRLVGAGIAVDVAGVAIRDDAVGEGLAAANVLAIKDLHRRG